MNSITYKWVSLRNKIQDMIGDIENGYISDMRHCLDCLKEMVE